MAALNSVSTALDSVKFPENTVASSSVTSARTYDHSCVGIREMPYNSFVSWVSTAVASIAPA